MKKQLLLIICFALGGVSQSKAQSTINVSGNSAKINGMSFDYSIGEMTLVSTKKTDKIIVTQGLLQPEGAKGGGDQAQNNGGALVETLKDITVYPNPTQDQVYIKSELSDDQSIRYQLYDATGKTILSGEASGAQVREGFQLNISSLAAASYYLWIQKIDIMTSQYYSFKIQKVN